MSQPSNPTPPTVPLGELLEPRGSSTMYVGWCGHLRGKYIPWCTECVRESTKRILARSSLQRTDP